MSVIPPYKRRKIDPVLIDLTGDQPVFDLTGMDIPYDELYVHDDDSIHSEVTDVWICWDHYTDETPHFEFQEYMRTPFCRKLADKYRLNMLFAWTTGVLGTNPMDINCDRFTYNWLFYVFHQTCDELDYIPSFRTIDHFTTRERMYWDEFLHNESVPIVVDV